MPELLEQVLADEREDVAVLRRKGDPRTAEILERVLDRVARAAEPFTTWLSEKDAMLRSGKAVPWLRDRFPMWERQGLARRDPVHPRKRQYLECIVPVRLNLDAVRADAARAAADRPAVA